MKVLVAHKRGFCFGVQRAIKKATQALARHGKVYSLGPVIHNPQVVQQLHQQGLIVIQAIEQIPPGSAMLIRSHGLPRQIIQQAQQHKLQIIDATCPLVKRAQQIVAKLHKQGYQVLMIGDPQHPEVKGIIGYAPNVIVVQTTTEMDSLAKDGKFGIVAQTTLSRKHVAEMIGKIIVSGFAELLIVDTLCNEANLRQQSALQLCRQVDVMFVLGGLQSSNTRQLADLCSQQGIGTFHLEDWNSFELSMVDNCKTAGVTAGASTPDSMVQDFATRLEKL